MVKDLIGATAKLKQENSHYDCEVEGAAEYAATLERLATSGATIIEAHTEHVSLEKYFMNAIREADEQTQKLQGS